MIGVYDGIDELDGIVIVGSQYCAVWISSHWVEILIQIRGIDQPIGKGLCVLVLTHLRLAAKICFATKGVQAGVVVAIAFVDTNSLLGFTVLVCSATVQTSRSYALRTRKISYTV